MTKQWSEFSVLTFHSFSLILPQLVLINEPSLSLPECEICGPWSSPCSDLPLPARGIKGRGSLSKLIGETQFQKKYLAYQRR